MQALFTAKTMPKKGRKKLKITESDSNTDIAEVPLAVKAEIVDEDTKEITGVEHEVKWG